MEMKLPTAPSIEDQGQVYRLQKINEIQAFLEKEVMTREALSKKYSRTVEILDGVVSVLIGITLGGGIGGISLLSTVVAAPAVIVIEGVALFMGFLSIIGKYTIKKSNCKAVIHDKIKTIASAKLNAMTSYISKALSDNEINDEEFRLFLEELEKYKVMKEEVRTKTKKKITVETREAHDSFLKLAEKKKR